MFLNIGQQKSIVNVKKKPCDHLSGGLLKRMMTEFYVRGIRCCHNENCGAIFNRDYNAAINI